MKLLHLDSSITGDGSVSRQLSAAVVAKLRAADPAAEISYRDLVAEPIEHLTLGHLPAASDGPERSLMRATARRSTQTAGDTTSTCGRACR